VLPRAEHAGARRSWLQEGADAADPVLDTSIQAHHRVLLFSVLAVAGFFVSSLCVVIFSLSLAQGEEKERWGSSSCSRHVASVHVVVGHLVGHSNGTRERERESPI